MKSSNQVIRRDAYPPCLPELARLGLRDLVLLELLRQVLARWLVRYAVDQTPTDPRLHASAEQRVRAERRELWG